ncbi:MAG: aldehyde dehydrogenase family protein [Calditrichaeota bacterium]|jgi:acyl-CoA reductase-like NAD-dependent aldehyde dehydrogenase|nr:aldehyde dehydrogenase family protein [Calditrichota bacterium]MBT7789971.1 aldehyde dehydrogenase family protein [Calditrichota bacterium]
MLKEKYPYYLANKPVYANTDLEVRNKYSGELVTKVAMADPQTIDEAIEWSVKAADPMRKLPSFKKAEILHHCVRRFQERYDELAYSLCVEAGKPIKDARGEVTRLIDTFRIAAEEAVRFSGEYLPLDISPRAEGYESITKRVPIGPCSFISPFNFPLNLTAHKIAPAIAVGCPFVLKPASLTPIGALIIGEILAETDLPEGAFSILPATRDGAGLFTTDDRLKLLSFTGSPDVGWALKAKSGKKKVVLELGGNAGCIVDKDTDLEFAADRITFGAFYQSGQSCIGVQRVFIHEDLYDQLVPMLIDRARKLKSGDPIDEKTSMGPIISQKEADRIDGWISEAVSNGAKALCGAKRDGVTIEATWLEGAKPEDNVVCQEVFGPVAVVEKFSEFKDAIAKVNDSDFGLQAGIFTNNIHHAFYAWNELEVGGVVINDIPSLRVDNMPYGGVKDSGLGREGVKYAMEDMSEIRLLVLNRIGEI